jgi:hypothetical protein
MPNPTHLLQVPPMTREAAKLLEGFVGLDAVQGTNIVRMADSWLARFHSGEADQESSGVGDSGSEIPAERWIPHSAVFEQRENERRNALATDSKETEGLCYARMRVLDVVLDLARVLPAASPPVSEGEAAEKKLGEKVLPQDRRRLQRVLGQLHLGELVTLDSLDFAAFRHIGEALGIEVPATSPAPPVEAGGNALVSFMGGPLGDTGGFVECNYEPIHLTLPGECGSYVFSEIENDGEGASLVYEWKPLAEGETFPDGPEARVILADPVRELRRIWERNDPNHPRFAPAVAGDEEDGHPGTGRPQPAPDDSEQLRDLRVVAGRCPTCAAPDPSEDADCADPFHAASPAPPVAKWFISDYDGSEPVSYTDRGAALAEVSRRLHRNWLDEGEDGTYREARKQAEDMLRCVEKTSEADSRDGVEARRSAPPVVREEGRQSRLMDELRRELKILREQSLSSAHHGEDDEVTTVEEAVASEASAQVLKSAARRLAGILKRAEGGQTPVGEPR